MESQCVCTHLAATEETVAVFDESASLQSPFTVLALEYDCNIVHAEARLTEAFVLRKQAYIEMCKSKSKALDRCPLTKSIRDDENLVQVARQKLYSLRRERVALSKLMRSQSSALAQDAYQLRRLLKRHLIVEVDPPSSRISSGVFSRSSTTVSKSPLSRSYVTPSTPPDTADSKLHSESSFVRARSRSCQSQTHSSGYLKPRSLDRAIISNQNESDRVWQVRLRRI
jgi:hypothetical protein